MPHTAEQGGSMSKHRVCILIGVILLACCVIGSAQASPAEHQMSARVRAEDFCAGVSQIPQSECAALVALYQQTGGPGWADHSGWLENATPCQWKGVACRDGRVIELNLSNNLLNGALPAQLANLGALEDLMLSGNALGGAIPPELGALTALRALGLDRNALTGAIPASLANLDNLEALFLGENHLEGAIPALLGDHLKRLTFLQLNNNRLSGALPSSIGDLPQLWYLNLSNNALVGEAPRSMLGLGALTSLFLDYNALYPPGPLVAAFLERLSPGWQNTQTVAPKELRAEAVSRGTRLYWAPIPFTGSYGYYEIAYSSMPGGPYTVHGRTANKQVDTYLASDVPATYYFVVRSFTAAHDGQQNDVWSTYGAEVSVAHTFVRFPLMRMGERH
jgi:hypothetical protein